MPDKRASWTCVSPSLWRAPASATPGSWASDQAGKASRHGTVSRSSSNPSACTAARAASAFSIGPRKIKVQRGSVGCFFMSAGIAHLDKARLAVPHFPHRHIGRTTFFEVTVMACRGELPIVGPGAPDRSLYFNLSYECQKALLDPQGQSGNPDAFMYFDGPSHE